MPRNPQPAWRGIGGRHAAESMADIGRNTHPHASNAEHGGFVREGGYLYE